MLRTGAGQAGYEKDRPPLPYWGRGDPNKEAERARARRHRTYTRAARV